MSTSTLPWKIHRATHRDHVGASDAIMPASFDPNETDRSKWPFSIARLLCSDPSCEDYAALIVRAVNSHEQLVAACKAFIARYDNHIVNADVLFKDVADQCRAALTIAGATP